MIEIEFGEGEGLRALLKIAQQSLGLLLEIRSKMSDIDTAENTLQTDVAALVAEVDQLITGIPAAISAAVASALAGVDTATATATANAIDTAVKAETDKVHAALASLTPAPAADAGNTASDPSTASTSAPDTSSSTADPTADAGSTSDTTSTDAAAGSTTDGGDGTPPAEPAS